MPLFGGASPWPLRFGGGVPRLQRIVESLQLARGPLYSTSQTSAVYVENNAYARVIDRDGYGCNDRLANQFFPGTSTVDGLLPRWEKIFGITPSPTDPQTLRQARVTAAWQRLVGNNDAQGLMDTIAGVLGQPGAPNSLLVQVVRTTPTNAESWWPGHPNPLPDPNIPTPWLSTIAHLAIQVQQPASMTEGVFLQAVSLAMQTLDGLLPAWCTFDWFTVDATAGVQGFYLDSYENLLRDAFDV